MSYAIRVFDSRGESESEFVLEEYEDDSEFVKALRQEIARITGNKSYLEQNWTRNLMEE